jgi:hypothetical protein
VNRLDIADVVGKTIVLRLKQKHPDAGPTTYMGHGRCIDISKSAQLPGFTDDLDTIAEVRRTAQTSAQLTIQVCYAALR